MEMIPLDPLLETSLVNAMSLWRTKFPKFWPGLEKAVNAWRQAAPLRELGD
jgi:hypothetical protein